MKYYVFPTRKGFVYFNVRSEFNPYNDEIMWCASCPGVFGGRRNDGESINDALIRETLEESHDKINLNSARFNYLTSVNAGREDYVFYTSAGGDFSFSHSYGDQDGLEQAETTGELFSIHLSVLNEKKSNSQIGNDLLLEFGDPGLTERARTEFIHSKTLKAFCYLLRNKSLIAN